MASNLVGLLREHALRYGDKTAFSFIRSNGVAEERLSYRELDERAAAVAARLQSTFAGGERALLFFQPGLSFVTAFFGCLYAGIVAVPVSPPRRMRPSRPLQAVIASSEPAVVLGAASLDDQVRQSGGDCPELTRLPWIAMEDVDVDLARRYREPGIDEGSLAFLQYTSGSTATPKGVMVSHGNLWHNSQLIKDAFRNTADTVGVFWLPLFHDMGLIGGVLQPAFCGGSSILMAPTAFLQRPMLWLETIFRFRATVSGGPDFAYDLCARKVTDKDRADLDLSGWKVAFTGSEPIRAGTLNRFAEAFAPCGFRREAFLTCYGLAEATLMVSGASSGRPPVLACVDGAAMAKNRVAEPSDTEGTARVIVGCGPVLPDQRIAIVDPDTSRLCPPGRVGEIWVQGASVAQGYFRRPDVSEGTFRAHLADNGEGPFLRTGDLGFIRGNELFVTGRLKDLIIIRGRNLYPEDIEWTVQQAHDDFRVGFCAAFSVDVDGQERLVVVQEIEPRQKSLNTDAALEAIRHAIAAHHEIEVWAIVLARAGTIPKTSSGKTQRFACRDLYVNGEIKAIAERTRTASEDEPFEETAPDALSRRPEGAPTAGEIEAWLVERLAARLGIAPGKVKVSTPFADFGMGSLDAMTITAELERWIGRRLSPTSVYNYPTIATLARWLANESRGPASPAAPSAAASGKTRKTEKNLLKEVQGLSDEQIDSLLLNEIAKQDN